MKGAEFYAMQSGTNWSIRQIAISSIVINKHLLLRHFFAEDVLDCKLYITIFLRGVIATSR